MTRRGSERAADGQLETNSSEAREVVRSPERPAGFECCAEARYAPTRARAITVFVWASVRIAIEERDDGALGAHNASDRTLRGITRRRESPDRSFDPARSTRESRAASHSAAFRPRARVNFFGGRRARNPT